MFAPRYTNRFAKDLKRCIKRGKDPEKLKKVVSLLLKKGKLTAKYREHQPTSWKLSE